jgi:hypothetical protein
LEGLTAAQLQMRRAAVACRGDWQFDLRAQQQRVCAFVEDLLAARGR